MNIDFNNDIPIFQQVADLLSENILTGAFVEEGQIPSITELSVNLKINPATALKGINILVDDGIVYKRRGLGMFVAKGGVEKLIQKRRDAFFENYAKPFIEEADRLNIKTEDLVKMIKGGK